MALVGPNGAGKTTLLKIAMGMEYCDRGSVITARNIKVGYLSQDLSDSSYRSTEGETALVYEKVYRLERELRDLERQMTIHGGNTASPEYKELMDKYAKMLARYEAMDGYNIETRIKKVLVGLGLRQDSLGTPLDRLSGGEKMRVAMARLLLDEPDLLILDEPTNHLDIYATEWLEGFLKNFRGGIIFVSHDRYFLDRVATRIAELEQGSLAVRSGNYANYMHHKKQLGEFVQSEQRRLRWTIRKENETVQGLISRGKIKAAKSREKEIQKLRNELKVDLQKAKKQDHLFRSSGPKIKFKQIKHVSKDIAWAENLGKSFGNIPLFKDATFHIRGGDRIGIIGPNGCGKSTLINMLLGNDKDYSGFLRLGDWVKYAYMGQEVLFENEAVTALELITNQGRWEEGEARDYLARFQFYGDDVLKNIRVLSGGERVRLYLSCMMLEDADCLILDEPTNHLDVPARDAFEDALREFKGTILAVTHDRYFLTHCVGKIMAFKDGHINLYAGNYQHYKDIQSNLERERLEEKRSSALEKSKKAVSARESNKVRTNHTDRDRQLIEAEIVALEDKIKELEGSFNEFTPREKYQEYADLQKQIDQLYNQWETMIVQ